MSFFFAKVFNNYFYNIEILWFVFLIFYYRKMVLKIFNVWFIFLYQYLLPLYRTDFGFFFIASSMHMHSSLEYVVVNRDLDLLRKRDVNDVTFKVLTKKSLDYTEVSLDEDGNLTNLSYFVCKYFYDYRYLTFKIQSLTEQSVVLHFLSLVFKSLYNSFIEGLTYFYNFIFGDAIVSTTSRVKALWLIKDKLFSNKYLIERELNVYIQLRNREVFLKNNLLLTAEEGFMSDVDMFVFKAKPFYQFFDDFFFYNTFFYNSKFFVILRKIPVISDLFFYNFVYLLELLRFVFLT